MKAEIDRKIGEVLVSTDEKARRELYAFILGTLHEQAVYLPVSYLSNLAVYHRHVTGFQFLPMKYEVPLAGIDIQQKGN